ncbi:hypothetical protein RJ641_025952 [Dillenia turbinata]|uniref:GIY-YIG domain-containing protein n=1 Tax=Dillenia turbinata TaxID=194707 RepID=A0AAN8ZTM9_9MAGN
MRKGAECDVVSRLKREDCNKTKHDSVFSRWKAISLSASFLHIAQISRILIGPSDWENHSLGKEGCGRYRIHNLPNCHSPGLYELGIAACPMGTGRIEKLDPESIVVVYLGQADNVRTRLQRYGREGAHLENNSTSCHGQANDLDSVSPGKGGGLFKEIFSRGYSIVYRWAPESVLNLSCYVKLHYMSDPACNCDYIVLLQLEDRIM